MDSKFIPLSVPHFAGNELEYVNQAVASGWVAAGEFITRFESDIAKYLNVPKAVACQSGSAGLHLAMLAAGIGSGDEVIVPTLTFMATVNPVRYVGAEPVFMDCDDSLCMNPDKLEDFLQNECSVKNGSVYNNHSKAQIKAVIVVHVFGNLADMERISDICEKYHLPIIEDATEALGSYFASGRNKGKFAGTIGDIGIYSFNGNKIITTGGGGMIVSRSSDDLRMMEHLSKQAKADEVNFIHDAVGYNYRMTNLQAALGTAQLERLEQIIEIKKDNYELYKNRLKDCNWLEILDFRENTRPNYWFYSLLIKNGTKQLRDGLIKHLEQNKIQSRPIWLLNHLQKPYLQCQSFKVTKAYECWEKIVNIPCSSSLSADDVRKITGVIKEYKIR